MGYAQTHRQQGDLTGLLLFFQNKKNWQWLRKYVPAATNIHATTE
jgi:hypothetical protein